MKHCPNEECRHRIAHGHAAEYGDDNTTCSDCGSPLEDGGVGETTAEEVPTPRWQSRRLAITISCAVAAYLATRVLLPGLDSSLVSLLEEYQGTENLSVVALGILPFVSATLTVEVVALVVPRWRALRRSGPAERWKLFRAALVLTPILAFFQGFGLAIYVEGLGNLPLAASAPAGWGPRLMTSVTLTAGTAFLMGLAAIVHRYGVGNGISVLLAGAVIPSLVRAVAEVGRAAHAQELSAFAGAVAIGVLALPAIATWRITRANHASKDATTSVHLPASGLAPITFAASLLMLPATLANLGIPFVESLLLTAGSTTKLAAESALVLIFCAAFGLLFHLPSNVRRVAPAPIPQPALQKAIAASALYLLALLLASHLASSSQQLVGVDVLTVAVLTAVVMDVLSELRQREDNYVSVWPIHQQYAVPVAVEALRSAKIACCTRGLQHHALLQFYGPFVPVEIMVSDKVAKKARKVIRNALMNEAKWATEVFG